MEFLRRFSREVAIGVLILANIFVWISIEVQSPNEYLKVSFLDVGQGDAILVETPSHKTALIDGGPSKSVLSEIGSRLPFGTRKIDILLESHPDKDHIGGLPEVVGRYDVGVFLEPGVESENSIDEELHKRLEEKGVASLLARRGMQVDFGDGAKLLILFPHTDVSTWETNDASIVAKLTYGEKSFLLTGDSTKKVEFILYGLNQEILDSDVLKAGHHGSRTSTSLLYAEVVSPEYAVISAGQDNTYGHPHKEILDILNQVGAKIVGTADLGTITFETDGETLEIK